MDLCTAFSTTPDVAARLTAPSLLPLTRACLDVERARRVVEEFRTLQSATDEQAAAIRQRWAAGGDGEFFKELLLASGRTQPDLGEV